MESARINPKNPQGDYLLRPTCACFHVEVFGVNLLGETFRHPVVVFREVWEVGLSVAARF